MIRKRKPTSFADMPSVVSFNPMVEELRIALRDASEEQDEILDAVIAVFGLGDTYKTVTEEVDTKFHPTRGRCPICDLAMSRTSVTTPARAFLKADLLLAADAARGAEALAKIKKAATK